MELDRRAWTGIAAGCVALAALSLAVVPAAPGYDPWSWLLWGREVAHLELHTQDGPAFKPLPVLVAAALAPAGGAAPELWLVLARAAALAAVVLAFVAAARAAGTRAPWAAGAFAAVGVVLTDRFVLHAAIGDSEPALCALVLAAFLRDRAGHPGQALALGAAAALLRTEAWPFLALYGAWRWRTDPGLRPWLAGIAVLVPAAWFVPEWLSSGQLLRSADRALVPNPGAPALADRPALETLERAAGLLFVPAGLGLLAIRTRQAALVAAAALAWLVLVAAMSEAGFSGEERYALPGAVLLAVAGGVGLARLATSVPGPVATAGVGVLVAAFGAFGVARIADLGPRLASAHRLAADLPRVIDAAGGRTAVLGCGRPAVGRYRGPLLAYHLGVPKRAVRADGAPGGVSFRSRLRAGQPLSPPRDPAARPVAAVGRWRVEGRCASAPSREGSARASWTGP